ncbi:uncharacterized protein LOC143208196 isoform X2 [Lasioglossum baleicum]|uniref:uncharacterized protein LOC143208196 isoform X2 n=1 Tax=Lasioglossum baleicum TaxID=434251 RepID=UPI003FCDF8B4
MRLLRAIRRRVDESLSLCSFSLFNEPTFYGTAGNRANVETTTAMERTRSAAQRPMGGEGVVRAKGCAPSTVSKTHSPRSEENRRIEGIAVSKASLSIGKSQCEGNSKRRKREKESGL